MVATREALRMQIKDANDLKTASKAAHESEMKASLFTTLQSALKPNAPLLLHKLETECKQSGAYSELYDGLAAWEELEKRGKTAAQRPGEAANHDARLTMLDVKPLAADATPDQFSARVSDAIVNIIPYLKRKFGSEEEKGEWVLTQVPEKHASECRTKYDTLSAAEKADPHAVANMCTEVISVARPTREILKEGAHCLFTVGVHARAMDFGSEDLFKTALHLLVYMGQTHSDGILYSRHSPNARELTWWSDSDWDTRRSTTGGTGQLAGGSVHAVSRRQDCVTGSSTHAEVVAASSNSNGDLVWGRGYLDEIGLRLPEPTRYMVDAKNVMTLVYNLISSKQTRHITRRELIVREREVTGDLEVTKVASEDNIADILTKLLDRVPFTKLRRLLLNLVVAATTCSFPRSRRSRAA